MWTILLRVLLFLKIQYSFPLKARKELKVIIKFANAKYPAISDDCFRLRLQQMRDEFSEEFNNPMDETVDGIIDDITRRADQTR